MGGLHPNPLGGSQHATDLLAYLGSAASGWERERGKERVVGAGRGKEKDTCQVVIRYVIGTSVIYACHAYV